MGMAMAASRKANPAGGRSREGGDAVELFRKILIPVDGSENSEQVLLFAGPFFEHATEPVELLRLVPPFPLGSPLRPLRAGQEGLVAEEKASARRYLTELADRFAHVSVGFAPRVDVAEPASGILDRIEATKPSLVAMTTHGRSGVSRWIRGSVAEKVLRSVQVPLFLAQPGSRGRIRRVLVPLDGSEASARIVPLVGQFAKALGAEVVLFHVGLRQGGVLAASATGGAMVITERSIRDGLEPYQQDLAAVGVSSQTRADFGLDPAANIMEALQEEEIDAIAMTSHGRRGFDRWVLGSVAEKVLRRCSRPLLLLPLRGHSADQK
jgi:nucleotide-binding universal stress UspA family protein